MPRNFQLQSFFMVMASLVPACGAGETSSDDVDADDVSDCCGDDLPLQLDVDQDVDILFVIDNSASMGQAQAILAADIDALLDVLEDPEVDANYRIGVTTTDNGNPWCAPSTTTPEAGALVASSCKTRLDDFVVDGLVDVQDLACNDICTLTDAELEILPTASEYDPDVVPRPWLERVEGQSNIPAGTDMADAFRCFAPQGVAGCGFESQLESMYLALDRSFDESDPSFGFVRDGAILAIVIVTDEVDCSYDQDWADIFAADGNKVFWSDPTAAAPTSALCWNAGVECMGDPSGYDSCEPVNKDIDGNVSANIAEAVLYPVSRYVDRVQAVENSHKELNADRDVIVTLIAGVTSEGSAVYADDLVDPAFQDEYGIGAGCTSPAGVPAIPPVRMRAFSEAFTPDNMFSICDPDYTSALQTLAAEIRAQIGSGCYAQCVADTNLDTPILDPECVVEQYVPGQAEVQLDECKRNPDDSYAIDPATQDYVMPTDEHDVCYALRVDSTGLTSDPADDLSPECADYNYILEFEIARRVGVPAPGGTAIVPTCVLHEYPQVACPNIGSSDG